MKAIHFQVEPLGVNCTILTYNNGEDCLIVDPGGSEQRISKELAKTGATLQMVLLTHTHYDHIGAVAYVKEKYDVPVYCHELELPLLQQVNEWISPYNLDEIKMFTPDKIEGKYLHHGQTITLSDNTEIHLKHVPGHSPGSICFHIPAINLLLAGDTLFRLGMGRTDIPLAQPKLLLPAIKKHLLTLPDNTKVIPGHDAFTTIGFEKQNNPHLRR